MKRWSPVLKALVVLAAILWAIVLAMALSGCSSAETDDRRQSVAALKAEYTTLTTTTWKLVALDYYPLKGINYHRAVFESTSDSSLRRFWFISENSPFWQHYMGLAVGDVVRLVSRRPWDESKESVVDPNRIKLEEYMRPERIP